jgi:hypothetical protein
MIGSQEVKGRLSVGGAKGLNEAAQSRHPDPSGNLDESVDIIVIGDNDEWNKGKFPVRQEVWVTGVATILFPSGVRQSHDDGQAKNGSLPTTGSSSPLTSKDAASREFATGVVRISQIFSRSRRCSR